MPPRRPRKPAGQRQRRTVNEIRHPGVLAAHDGPVTEAECAHPPARRDGKNPARCCACGTTGLAAPVKPPKGRGRR